jgi:hypothetical protein
MANTTQAACFCMGKAPDCTCGGACRCACTCWKDKVEETTFKLDWMTEVDPNEGQEMHKTRGGKGIVGQAIARDKKHKLPPNCS